MTTTMPNNNGGLFSSLTSLFSGATLGGAGPSSGAYLDRKRSSGLPTSMRRQGTMHDDDEAAWRLPYNQYPNAPDSAASTNGMYPPPSASAATLESYPSFSVRPNANESTSTLTPGAAQSRHSLSLATNVSIPSTAYPPLKHTWRRIRSWCEKNYTELGDTLNWPATEAQLDDLELTIGFSLPPAVRDSYLCFDGQEVESNQSCSDGLFFGLPLLSVDQIADEWRFWRNVDDDPSTGANAEVKGWMCSCPAGWVRAEYSNRGWIPLITDRMGNYIGVDLSPNPSGGGSPGQVILFGRDFDTKIVLWRGEGEGGWGRFLQYIAEELEGGELWTLEDVASNDSNDEEDGIGYESYFSGGGSGAGRGGGDRGGDGAAGFKLRGEYKGWPVFEAWADRSMRCWEEIGMPTGQPAWRTEHPTPSVVLDEVQAADRQVDENGESLDAEGSAAHNDESAQLIGTPTLGATSPADAQNELSRGAPGQSHPLEASSSAPGTPTLDDGQRRHLNTLSPPPMHSYRGKQKQREDRQGAADTNGDRQRRAPPAPAAPLDLPTIDDVRAAHAAAVASQMRGGYHYDMERATRPPPGMGGMGMGMGMSGNPVYGNRQSFGRAPSSYVTRRSGDLPYGNGVARDEDGVELDNRSSLEGLYASKRDSELGYTSANDTPRTSMNGVSSTIAPSSASHLSAGRTLYTASTSSEAVDSLIDASSSPDVSIQIEGTKAAASNVHRPTHASQQASATSSAPNTSSPLASHSSAFTSMQSAAVGKDMQQHGSDASQPLTA